MRNRLLAPFIFVLICLAVCFANVDARGEESGPWNTRDLPFRVLSIASNGSKLWVCGTDETIFEPYLKDGVPVNVKLNSSVSVYVIKPR
jgi:hypothetical protein